MEGPEICHDEGGPKICHGWKTQDPLQWRRDLKSTIMERIFEAHHDRKTQDLL